MIRLVATDLDGTLLRGDKSVSPWTLSVLDALVERGVHVVPVTGRQPRALAPIAEQSGLVGWSVCVNGALVRHLVTGEVIWERFVQPDAMRGLARFLDERVPGVAYAAVQERGTRFVVGPGYRPLTRPADHQPAIQDSVDEPLDDLLSVPALKLLARHAEVPAVELATVVTAAGLPGVHATTSGDDFVEVAAAGVTKATALAALCEHLGIAREEVVAFGDAPNDVEMLAWAGRSWAMANACRAVREVASHHTTSNMDDGVGRALMELLRTGGVGPEQH